MSCDVAKLYIVDQIEEQGNHSSDLHERVPTITSPRGGLCTAGLEMQSR